jgi:transcriptional regulator with XRE-family HTH domain
MAAAFAATVRQRMRDLGLSQAEVARRVDVSDAAVAFWCDGTSEPREGNRRKLAAVLGVEEAELVRSLGGERDQEIGPSATTRRRLSEVVDELSAERLRQVVDFAEYLAMKDWRDDWQQGVLERIAAREAADGARL